ncbi:ABC transporter permease [Thalassobacillus pellis]|uniref:ABC transporter permease n=1 Tax=Thalassobacillus pellis TaxID=748008 RepID=UPI0019604EDF|nr:DUF2705 family protein [Thalassobacillus pellis]MBM7553732.1 ABC-2 type transport system permease protein [Thalassobacillus pellis]
MSNFFQLVRNEQMKLYSQTATWVMYGILAVLVIGFAIVLKVNGDVNGGDYGGNWEKALQEENAQLEKQMKENEFAGDYATQQIALNEYRIEHDIAPGGYNIWDFVQENQSNAAIISLFTIIVAAGIIANEFKWGTIKLLLLRPISRTKILFSKYVSVLVYAITMLVFLLILAVICGAIFFGIEQSAQPYLYYQDGTVQEMPMIQLVSIKYFLGSVNLVMMASFAFMISAVFRNSSLAIGIAIFLMMAGNSIVMFFADYDWSKFILFANTDLTQHIIGTPMNEDLTLSFSVTVLLVYFVIFLTLAWAAFTKRDVANA